MRSAFAIILFLLAGGTASAQNQDPYSTGNCEPAQSEAFLETGNARAKFFNNGPLFWKGGSDIGYEIPLTSGKSPAFVANFLLAGMIDDDIRVAGSSYGPWEFWPGPVPDGNVEHWDCSTYDRFWSLDYDHDFQSSDAAPTPTSAVLEWPVNLGAPFIEVNDQPGYQPLEGDVPAMNGDRQVWWIMNDRGNEHSRFATEPLGVEVKASVFGFDATNDLENVTFYRYRIENKGDKTIRDLTAGMHTDFDLGAAFDDRVGTDTTNALFYYYNADDDDEGRYGYGSAPPASGFAIIEARHSRGILPTDLGLPPSKNMAAARFYVSGGGVAGDPANADDLHLLMTGRWRDGSLQFEGGYVGYQSEPGVTDRPMPFYMPGDPVTSSFWSEVNPGGNRVSIGPSDRRGIQASPTFDLAPGEWAQFTFALVWARGESNLDSITQLRNLTADLHASAGAILAPRAPKPPNFVDGNTPEEPQYPFWVDEPYPNPVPSGDEFILRLSARWDTPITITVSDLLGRLQMQSTRPTQPGETSIPIPTEAWAPGIYLVKVQQRHESVVQRVIVQ